MSKPQPAVLITGSNGGIGRVLCRVFQKAGYYTIASDIIKPQGEYNSDTFIQADLLRLVREDTYRQDKYQEFNIALRGKTLKGLVNNAAVQKLDHLDNVSLEDFAKTLDVNVMAPLLMVKLFLNNLEQAKGAVVNIGSIHSKLTKPAFISYATSKAALLGLTQALAVDLGERVRVNIIQPAATETEMLLEGFKDKGGDYDTLKDYHPMKRVAIPVEIASAALFLISEDCRFMTGSSIDINGGIGCRLHDPE